MPTMLRHKTTGDMYIYSRAMAKRDDMEVVEDPDLSPVAEKAAESETVVQVVVDAEVAPKKPEAPSVETLFDGE